MTPEITNCTICQKPLGYDTKEQGFTTCHDHRDCDIKILFPSAPSVETTPDVRFDMSETLTLTKDSSTEPMKLWDSGKSDDLNAALLRIRELEDDIAVIENGRRVAERQLEFEKLRARELASNSTLQVHQDWVALANEMAQLNGKQIGEITPPDGLSQDQYKALMEQRAMDFVNRLRYGALELLDSDPEEILVVKSRAYEIWWKACNYLLNNKSIKLKISERDKFEEIKKQQSAARVEVAREKQERKRPVTGEEKLMASLTKLLGTREAALQHMEKARAAGLKVS